MLVTIQSQVIGAFLGSIGGSELARIIALARLFDFDHGRPQVAQNLGAVRPCKHT